MRAAAVPAILLVLAALPAAPSQPEAGSLVLDVKCDGPFMAMEVGYSFPTCWHHVGHHTYFLGRDTTYLLRSIEGLAFSVEQQFSLPTEGTAPFAGAGVNAPANAGLDSVLPVETSLDGVTWRLAGTGSYRFLGAEEVLDRALCPDVCQSLESLWRMNVLFDIQGEGQEFRFLRVRQPYSQATQGLSGFLDFSRLTVTVDVGTPVAPALADGARDLGCAGAMEAISNEHPCWFGGIDRYDSPSFFHTWFLGDARLARVNATATLLPWRLDDFYQPQVQANDTNVAFHVEVSADGEAWTSVGHATGPFGTPLTVDVQLDGVEAKFVRVAPEKHARFAQYNQPGLAPNHHGRGYFIASAVHVEGMLAA